MKLVKFKIQNLVLSSDRLPDEHFAMMYRGSRHTYDKTESCHCWNPGDFVEFFTYFNAFSINKWRKYTNVKNVYLQLRCKGKFKLTMFGHYDDGTEIRRETYEDQVYNLPNFTNIKISIPCNTKAEIIGFQFNALDPYENISVKRETNNVDRRMCIESGGWYTDILEELINDVRISIATTTFKNEDYIKRNIDVLERELFYSSEAVRNHIRMIIIDNGRTLNPEEYNSEFITIHSNINVGGAGGFTRGIIESIDVKDFIATHILLMDDDVSIMPEAFVRTYSLLALIKPEYKERFISGAMLYFERMNIQHEDVGYVHEDGSYGPNKKIMDMEKWDSVFENDKDIVFHKNSYAGWWYCCIPVSKISSEHLPIPLFIRGDDVEFSIANNAEFLTLNGICIWHKGFANKFNANLELYMVHRNSLIIQSMSGICKDIDFIERIDGFFKSNLCRLAYNNCELLLDAIEEFSAGPDFLNEPDGERIMKEHAEKNEKMTPINLVYDGKIDFNNIYKYENTALTEREKWIYFNTYNGQTLPDSELENGKTAVIAYDWFDDPAKQFMAEQILAVNIHDHTAVLRKRDKKRFKELIERYERVMSYYKENKIYIEESYRNAAKRLQSVEFWREYLNMK